MSGLEIAKAVTITTMMISCSVCSQQKRKKETVKCHTAPNSDSLVHIDTPAISRSTLIENLAYTVRYRNL